MIAAGSGIAPFRSFWQARLRQAEVGQAPFPLLSILHLATWKNSLPLLFLPGAQAGVSLGPMILVFGCRRESMDLLRKETDKLGCVLSRWSKDWSPMIKILMLDDRWSRDCYFTDPQNRGDDEGWLGGCLPSRAPRLLLTIEKVILCFLCNFGYEWPLENAMLCFFDQRKLVQVLFLEFNFFCNADGFFKIVRFWLWCWQWTSGCPSRDWRLCLVKKENRPSMFRLLIWFLLIFFWSISFQDIVEENADLVHKLWVEGKGYLYVCGKVHFWIWIFLDKYDYRSKPKCRIQNYCLCVHVQLGSSTHLLL